MGDKSRIEWTDATWNPFRGCTRIAEGCRNCYAERMMARGLPGLMPVGYSTADGDRPFAEMTPAGPRWTGRIDLIESQLEKPLRWRRGRRIFVNSMSDTFHERVPFDWILRLLGIVEACPQHTFMFLTKRGEGARLCLMEAYRRMKGPLSNVWLGVSASTQADLERELPQLLATPAAVRFLSLEPLLERVDIEAAMPSGGAYDWSGLHWVIVGGESGPGARPMDPDWARSVRDQCRAAGVPFFFKQHGKKALGRHLDGREWNEFPGVAQ